MEIRWKPRATTNPAHPLCPPLLRKSSFTIILHTLVIAMAIIKSLAFICIIFRHQNVLWKDVIYIKFNSRMLYEKVWCGMKIATEAISCRLLYIKFSHQNILLKGVICIKLSHQNVFWNDVICNKFSHKNMLWEDMICIKFSHQNVSWKGWYASDLVTSMHYEKHSYSISPIHSLQCNYGT